MSSQNKKIILIVEDEKPLSQAMIDKLQRKNFETRIAKNGADGLEIALRERPDLILLDIIMPVMDGITMLKKLRNENEWGKLVPVIILTNLSGADDVLNKDITELEPAYYLIKSDLKLTEVIEKICEVLGEN